MLPGVAGLAGFSGQAANPAIQYVGGVTSSWVNTTSPNLDLTALTGGSGGSPLQNDLVLVFFVISDVTTGTPANPSIVTAGYNVLNAILSQSDIARSKLGSWYKFMGASPDTAVDLGDMTGDQSAVAQARVYRYVNLSTPIDTAVATAGGTNSGQPNPAACTPATQGAALIMAAAASADNNMTSAEVVAELDAYASATAGHSGSGLLVGHALNCTAGVPIDPTTSGGSSNGNDCWNALTFALRPL